MKGNKHTLAQTHTHTHTHTHTQFFNILYKLIATNLILYNSIYCIKLVDVKIIQSKYLNDVTFLTGNKHFIVKCKAPTSKQQDKLTLLVLKGNTY